MMEVRWWIAIMLILVSVFAMVVSWMCFYKHAITVRLNKHFIHADLEERIGVLLSFFLSWMWKISFIF